MQDKHQSPDRPALTPLKIVRYAGLAAGVLAVLCLLVVLIFPGPLVNRFVQPRVIKALGEAYPSYSIGFASMSYSIFGNRFEFDSVAVDPLNGSFSGRMGKLSVSGIGWMSLLWGGTLSPKSLTNAIVEGQDLVFSLPEEHYDLRCGHLRVSVPDSEMEVRTLTFHPSGDDEQFFAVSKFRQTRFRVTVPQASVQGLACLELLGGKVYRSRSARFRDPFLDVLINKDKSFAVDTASPPMPGEILASLPGTLLVDSLNIRNGRLLYGERFAVGVKPALLLLDSLSVVVKGIANHGDHDAAVLLKAQAIFMKAGTMNLLMSIPLAATKFSYHYSGSLSGMDLRPINGFVETAEQMRIKEGVLQEATFDIQVESGRASGNVRAVYRDLNLAAINKQTGSENGFLDGLASSFARSFKIRASNVPDQSGSMKIGEVSYTRKRDEFFLEFSWFALRSGVGDVVGF